ncbi:MAG: hypothetical protein ACRDBP_14760 [Luteolibacter sp.]
MNWIFDNFQIVVLVLLGVGSLVKSVLEAKAKAAREREGTYNQEEVFTPDEGYGEPKWPTILSVPPPLRQAGYDMEVASEAAKALKHQQDLAERLRQIRETKATTTGGAAATRARVAAKGVAKPATQVPPSIRARLQDSAEVRRAFVMREILDTPVGLR